MKLIETKRGSALLLVMWALILLSAAILGWARWIQQDIELAGQANRNAESRAMAHSGVAMALHPLVSMQSPQLQKSFGSQLGYEVRMVGEGGKFNINWLLAGEDPRKLSVLRVWLDHLGLKFQEREELIDCLLDYVDADNVKRLNGAEEEEGYVTANRPFVALEEIAKVRASRALVRMAGWKDSLTLYSGGPVDLLAAPREVLRAMPGLGDAQIERFIVYRAGKDGILGTLDDPPMKSLRDVQTFLGMNDTQFRALNGLVTVNDPVVHITALGQSGKVIRQVEVVARKGGGNPAILYWNE